ncbi:hypothetical protein Tco_0626161 [Tanacetum coccineum]|uniref:Uncharacterized protein n=1 Tax=Tanacetum coccineum TaxID=301880 RepID=A0ABQ4WIY9_9ASTR
MSGYRHYQREYLRFVTFVSRLTFISKLTGFSRAEFANVVDEAALLAAGRYQSVVGMIDFVNAVEQSTTVTLSLSL